MTLQDAFKLDYRTAAAAITGAGKPNFTIPVERGTLQVELYRPVKVNLHSGMNAMLLPRAVANSRCVTR